MESRFFIYDGDVYFSSDMDDMALEAGYGNREGFIEGEGVRFFDTREDALAYLKA